MPKLRIMTPIPMDKILAEYADQAFEPAASGVMVATQPVS